MVADPAIQRRSMAFSAGKEGFLQIDKRPIGIISLTKTYMRPGGLWLIYALAPSILSCIGGRSHPVWEKIFRVAGPTSLICSVKGAGVSMLASGQFHQQSSYASLKVRFSLEGEADERDRLIFRRAINAPKGHNHASSGKLPAGDVGPILENLGAIPKAADSQVHISSSGSYMQRRLGRSFVLPHGSRDQQPPEPSDMMHGFAAYAPFYRRPAVQFGWNYVGRLLPGIRPYQDERKPMEQHGRKTSMIEGSSPLEEMIIEQSMKRASSSKFISRRYLPVRQSYIPISDVARRSRKMRISGRIYRNSRLLGARMRELEWTDNPARSELADLVLSMPSEVNRSGSSSQLGSSSGRILTSVATAVRENDGQTIPATVGSFSRRTSLHSPEAPGEIDLSSLADRVYTIIERRTKIEMERRGLYSRS